MPKIGHVFTEVHQRRKHAWRLLYFAQNQERDDFVREKGCFILPRQLFCNVWAYAKNMDGKGKLDESDLNTLLSNTLSAIEASSVGLESEEDFRGLFDDFDTSFKRLGNSVANRNKRLLQLMDGIGGMDSTTCLGSSARQSLPRTRGRPRTRCIRPHPRWVPSSVFRKFVHGSIGR